MAGYSLGCRLLQQESRKVPMCFCSFSESFIRSERPSFQRLIVCCKPKRWNKLSVSFLNVKLLHFFGTRFGVGSDWSKSWINNNYGWIYIYVIDDINLITKVFYLYLFRLDKVFDAQKIIILCDTFAQTSFLK